MMALKDRTPSQISELSKLLHHYFKAQHFNHRPFWIEDFESAEDVPYDYILVDSRTGITEIGGFLALVHSPTDSWSSQG